MGPSSHLGSLLEVVAERQLEAATAELVVDGEDGLLVLVSGDV